MMTPEHIACTGCRRRFRPEDLKKWRGMPYCVHCYPCTVS